MRKNIFTKIIGLALAVSALMCFSCRQNLDEFNIINQDNAGSSKTVKVRFGAFMERTALPVVTDAAELTEIKLYAKETDSEADFVSKGTWDDKAAFDVAIVEFRAGSYDLKLTAKKDALSYEGNLKEVVIQGSDTMNLTFSMYVSALDSSLLSGDGDFAVKLAFNKELDYKAVKVSLFTVDDSNNDLETEVADYQNQSLVIADGDGTDGISSSYQYVTAAKTDLAHGHYRVKFTIYGDENATLLVDEYPEDIYIDGDRTSKSVIKLDDSAVPFTLDFALNGGAWADNYIRPTKYTRLSKPTLPTVSDLKIKSGYTFGGWYATSDFSGSEIIELSNSDSKNKTLYAKWNPNTYGITYNKNGGEFVSTETTSFVYDEDLILPRPVKEGYNFRGWFEDEACTLGAGKRLGRIKAKTHPGNVTLYAKWEPVTSVTMVYAYDINEITQKDYIVPLTHVCMAFIGHDTKSPSTDIRYRSYKPDVTRTKITSFRAKYPHTMVIGSYAGGDEGSDVCGDLIVNEENRHKIVENIVNFVAAYGLDGVDLDWEYFGSSEYTSFNPIYAAFTSELRAALDENFTDYILLTIAVQKGKKFHQDSRIKEMLRKYDFIGLMSYDCGSSQRGSYESQGDGKYKMASAKVPHISFNGRHKAGTWANGESTRSSDLTDVKDITGMIDVYADIAGADKLVAGIGYYGHAYYILPSGVQIEVPANQTDDYKAYGKLAGAEKAYFATVDDIRNDNQFVEGLETVHPAQGSVYEAKDWGKRTVTTTTTGEGEEQVTTTTVTGEWDYEQYKIAAGSTYDYNIWKSYSTGKEVTKGHFDSQDGFVAYEYFQTDVEYAYTVVVEGEEEERTCNLYALYVYDDPDAIEGKVAQYVKSVEAGGKGCAGAMAWVFESDADNDLHSKLAKAVNENMSYAAPKWSHSESGHGFTPKYENAIRYYNGTGSAFNIYDVTDLQALSFIVNSGDTLSDKTITVQNDITINDGVLTDSFLEPEEGPSCTPNPNLVNLDSIGYRNDADKDFVFSGTFDGNNKKISGLYIYRAHHGLGFIGNAKNATIKNVILLDACVINNNKSAASDGTDDDRFGGLIGIVSGTGVKIENCIFEGVVGSQAAKDRGGSYEYIGGLIGRCDQATTANNCIVLARVYGDANVICKKGADKITQTDVSGYDASNASKLADGKTAINNKLNSLANNQQP